HDRCFEPHSDQSQHAAVGDALAYAGEQALVWDSIEVGRKVRIVHRLEPGIEVSPDLLQGHVRTPAGAKPVGAVLEVGLEDRFQYQQGRHLGDTVPYGRYSQRAHLPVRFRDHHPSNRRGTVRLSLEIGLKVAQVGDYASLMFLDHLNRHTVHTRRSSVGAYSFPGGPEYVFTEDAVVQHVEPKARLSFGLLAQ